MSLIKKTTMTAIALRLPVMVPEILTGQRIRKTKKPLTIDATYAPVYIRYPRDVSLLNEAREKLEEMIAWFHKAYGISLLGRDCREARKHYLAFAKARKHSAKQIRKALKNYVER